VSWRRSIAYVTQEVYLFNRSIRYNLSWSAPDVSEEEIYAALEAAALSTTIKRLPEGLDTLIGDRGVRFSGGERQRLAIARALLTNPKLLILDEATSALDDDNEKRIQDVVTALRGKLTVLIIAHRKSTLEVADRIIDVKPLRDT
jgi:ATP-binding cassette subfamily C protein